MKSGGKLEPGRETGRAIEFIRTALAREDLAQAWNARGTGAPQRRDEEAMAERRIARSRRSRSGTSRRPGFNVVGTSPNEVLLEVLLVPKLNSGYVPTRYEVTLVRKGAKAPWKVSYFLPYAPPGIYTEPAE